MGDSGFKSGSSDPLLLYLDLSAIYCIDDTIMSDVHANGRAILKDGSHVIANLPVFRIQVLRRRNGRSSGLKLAAVKVITG